ncbi:hypothetical protein LWM68_11275 [Niabella sp. W65]|nr:hypothetical protein [Niabella sp. W65]MCH7363293.1 hypothetical protein [Niabella sp. W65]ULT39219.1 hypothetical protein KRR40_30010 [Niabella sp. I65]
MRTQLISLREAGRHWLAASILFSLIPSDIEAQTGDHKSEVGILTDMGRIDDPWY